MRTILVVEDEVLIRMSVSQYLRECGYRVLEAQTAEDAQTILRARAPVDLLFCDVNLGPGMTGIELCGWVGARFPDIRILITSGVTDMFEDAAHLCHGAFFSKPYVHATLAAEIRRLVGPHDRHSRDPRP